VAEAAPSAPRTRATTAGDRTIARLWRDATQKPRPGPAYLVEDEGEWRPVSWDEAARRVDDLAFGLLALGLRKGDTVGIIAQTRLEWSLLDFALALVGAVGAGIYPSSTAAECAYLLGHTDAAAVFAEDEERLAQIDGVRTELPLLEHVFTFADLEQLERRGREYRLEAPGALDEAVAAIDDDDLFTYIFTSGTTGPPKACMIRNRNYFEMASCVDRLATLVDEHDVMLLWLPLAHNFGRLMHLVGPHVGFTIAFVPDPYRVRDALPHVRPTVLPSAPRLFEKMYETVRESFESATGARRRLLDWALRVGYEVSDARRRGEQPLRALALRHRLADRLVYSKVKERVGGRLRFGISGAAPLAPEIAEFFHALDILILEGYGQTECTTACSVNRPERFKFGTVGPPLPGFEVRTDDDGEILVRSETLFAGYLKDEQATREVLTGDGWLRTGDVGTIDEDGFLRITDRKKDLIVTAGGKNVAPQNIERALKRAKVVSEALVVGDRRPYLVALLALEEDEVRGVGGAEPARATVAEAVEDVNRGLARHEQIKRFAILPRAFSTEHGELTPTLKLRRRVVERNFAAEIERLYEPRDSG
jgi:long-chain acyl-CoA synthetase